MTPLLFFFGFPPNIAVGTDLLYAALTKCAGAVAHQRKGTINWSVVYLLAAGSLPASLITIFSLTFFFERSEHYHDLLTNILGVMLILTSIVILYRTKIRKIGENSEGRFQRWVCLHRRRITLFMGAVLGVLVTLSSVGAGAFGGAVLVILYGQFRSVQVVGTDIAHSIPLAFVAGIGHLFLGNVDFALLGSLLIGSVPAIIVGSYLAARLPEKLCRAILGSCLLIIGIKFSFF